MTPTGAQPTRATRLTPGTQRQYLALLHQIATLPQGTPCTRHDGGLDWLDPRPDQQDQAAALCAGCPALDACAAYRRSNPKLPGVWAGRTEQQAQQRRARTLDPHTPKQSQQTAKAGQ